MARKNPSTSSNSSNGYRRELRMYLAHRMWKNQLPIILGMLGLILTFFAYTSWKLFVSKSAFQFLDIDSSTPEALRDIFQSGQPWMFYCTKRDRAISSLISKTARYLTATKIQIGLLDCTQKFPSGKTVYQRYALNKSIRPTIFTIANGEKAKQVYLNDLKDSKRLSQKIIQFTKKEIKELISQNSFEKNCTQRKLCVLFVSESKMSTQLSEMKSLMNDNRKIGFTWINLEKFTIESELEMPSDGSAIVFMRNEENESLGLVILSEGEFDGDLSIYGKVQQVLTRLAENKYEGFTTLKKKVTLKRIKSTPKTKKTNSYPEDKFEETKEYPTNEGSNTKYLEDIPETVDEEEIELEDE